MSLLTIERSNSCDNLSRTGSESDEDQVDGDSSEEVFTVRSRTSSFEGFFASKGAAYAIPDGDFARKATLTGGEFQSHLQGMVNLIRDEDAMRLIVKVESQGKYTRYLSIITTYGVTDEEESILLGFDWVDENVTIGLVIPLWSNVSIELDGDGGFKILTDHKVYIFKPVSVQTMWTALQWIHRCLATARRGKQFSGGMSHSWLGYYENRILSPRECIQFWEYTDELVAKREEGSFEKVKTDEELLKGLIRHKLKEILKKFDLDEVTCRQVREVLESEMKMSLRHLRGYIDEQMLVVVGQMDSATKITDTIFLGSEWNASNLEELKENGVGYILNVTKEIDNFFPGTFEYMNIRLHDVEEADLLRHWGKTYRFLHKAKEKDSVAFVHCRRGISRSASTVVAFLMKEYKMSLHDAMKLVKSKRSIVQPNPGFWKQLIIYEGILRSSENRHNSLFRRRSNSESNMRRSHKKMRRKISIEKSGETDQTDSPVEHAHTLPRIGAVSGFHCESPHKLEESDENQPCDDTSPQTSDSQGLSDDESASASDDEVDVDKRKLRRTQSEPAIKTMEEVVHTARKPRARTFVERTIESDEAFGVLTSPTKIPAIFEDSPGDTMFINTAIEEEDRENSEFVEKPLDSSLESQLITTVETSSEEAVMSVGKENEDNKVMVMDIDVKETTENTTEFPVDKPTINDTVAVSTETRKLTEAKIEEDKGTIGTSGHSDIPPRSRSRSIGSRLEDKMLMKQGKSEHFEIIKKVEGRGRVRRRERKSKSDLQLSESGFVKRHTQIFEEHMLYSILRDSEKRLTTNVATDQPFKGDVSSNSGKNCTEKYFGNSSENNDENIRENNLINDSMKNQHNDSVTNENDKNVLLGNQEIDHIVQVVNATAKEQIGSQLQRSRLPVLAQNDVTNDVRDNGDVCIDAMTWIDLTSHHGNVVKRKSAAFENLSEERAKNENKTKLLAETGVSEPNARPSKELSTSSVDERIPDVPGEQILGTASNNAVPSLNLAELSIEDPPDTSCTIIVEDYNKWETSSVRDRTTILENIIAKTGGSFPSPRSRKPKKKVEKNSVGEEIDNEVAQLFSNVSFGSQDDSLLNIKENKPENRSTSCPPVGSELNENDDFIDDKVKVLVDKFEGKDT